MYQTKKKRRQQSQVAIEYIETFVMVTHSMWMKETERNQELSPQLIEQLKRPKIITNFHFISSFCGAHVFRIKKFTLFNFLFDSFSSFCFIINFCLCTLLLYFFFLFLFFCVILISRKDIWHSCFVICIWFSPHEPPLWQSHRISGVYACTKLN